MENTVDTFIDGIIKQVPTLVKERYKQVAISCHRRLTRLVLEFVATYVSPKGECYVCQILGEKFSKKDANQNVDPVVHISATLTCQLEKIRNSLKRDFESHQLDSAPSELISDLSYKVWLSGSRLGSRYQGSLIT